MHHDAVSLATLTGIESEKFTVPSNATDCHHHIYDARFPADPRATMRPADALVTDYRLAQKRIGTTRNVVVQPSTYGLDNRLLLAALKEFGTATARGVAVVNTDVSDDELRRLHEAGVRGIRFAIGSGFGEGPTTLEMVGPLSRRIAGFGWHVQINISAKLIAVAGDLWDGVSCPIVFDHMGHIPQPDGIRHPAYALICNLMQRGKGWVKLSAFYADSAAGPPTYSDSVAVAAAYASEAPERVVWGSNWPHPTKKDKPDDAVLLRLLADCISEEAIRNRVLVANPALLYGFTKD